MNLGLGTPSPFVFFVPLVVQFGVPLRPPRLGGETRSTEATDLTAETQSTQRTPDKRIWVSSRNPRSCLSLRSLRPLRLCGETRLL